MSKTYYRSIWISDTHLCTRDCRADYLLSFLKKTKSEYLYLVGDFLDMWQLKRSWYWPQTFNNIIHKILGRAKKGTKVFYIPGNHDEFFREFEGHRFGGVEITKRVIHSTADGRRLLVLHGDEFDLVVQHKKWLAVLGSAAYDHLIVLNRIVNVFRRRMNLPYWSLAGAIKRRVKNAVTYVGTFEDAVIREAEKYAVDGVICGHIHQPVIKTSGSMTYYNTGDWVENCTALVERENGEMFIVNWLKDWHEIEAMLQHDEEEHELEVPAIGGYEL